MRAFNRLSIQSKLMSMLLAVSIGSIGVIAYEGYRSGRNALTASILNQLKSVRAAKASQVEGYFDNLRGEVKVLGSSLIAKESIATFTSAYQAGPSGTLDSRRTQLLRDFYRSEFAPRLQAGTGVSPNPDAYLPASMVSRYLQYEYLVDNPNDIGEKGKLDDAGDSSAYSKAHRSYHPFFRQVVDEFGYYDLFLIDNDGNIIYSVSKETDFATNLRLGSYARSGLATAFKEAQKQNSGYVAITDFDFYSASYGYPAAFAATPIYQGVELIGVLAVQISVDELNAVMTSNRQWQQEGLGNTGETFLVGSDFLLRSDSRRLIEAPEEYLEILRKQQVDPANLERIERLKTSIMNQPATSNAIKAAIAGKTGVISITNYLGKESLSAYGPLNVSGLDWVIVSEIEKGEIFSPITNFARRVLISAAGLVFLITLASIWLARNFLKPVDRLSEGFRKLAKGHQDVSVEVASADELGELAKSFNHMVKKNRKTSELVLQKSQETEALLLNMYPASVAKRLRRGESSITDSAESVTVMFANILNFQGLTAQVKPRTAIKILNEIVSALDDDTERYGVEKIKTTGSEYLAVSGLSEARLDHTKRIVDFAIEALRIVQKVSLEHNIELQMRIGVHSGSLMAGTVGNQRLVYDIWGDTVVTAHYVQSHAQPGTIFITKPVCNSLIDIYEFEGMGEFVTRGGEKLPLWKIKL